MKRIFGVFAVVCAVSGCGGAQKSGAPATRAVPVTTAAGAGTPSTRPVARASGSRGSDDGRPSIRAVPIRSTYETTTLALSRDIGVSVALPDGDDLWLFGDTSVYTRGASGNWTYTGFVDGSTALEGKVVPGQVPRGAEFPLGLPSRFIPVPENVYMPDGTGRPCIKGNGDSAFGARWPTGAAVVPSNTSEVLITYSEVCVTEPPDGSPSDRTEGWGYLLYNWREHRIGYGPIDVFKPQTNGAALAPSHVFGWPIYLNDRLTVFSSSCHSPYVTCGAGHVWSATPLNLNDPDWYQPEPMSTDGTSTWEPFAISVGKYAEGLRMVETTSIGGRYRILTAPTLATPWHLVESGTLPNCVPHRAGYCHGIEGHPELSTATEMFVSYEDPNSGPGGHMVMSAIPS